MKIVIDARIIYTSTGRYVERLITNLQQLDHDNQYIILLLKKDFERWQATAPNFTKQVADFKPYTFAEQLGFAWQLYRLKADLVHFTMPQQPLLYFKRKVTTMHDLTLVDFVNRRAGSLPVRIYKYQIKPAVFRFVTWWVLRTSYAVIAPTEHVRQGLIARYNLNPSRATVTLEAADALAAEPEPYKPLIGKDYLLYMGNAFPYKNVPMLVEAFARLQPRYPNLYLIMAGKLEFFYRELQHLVDAKQLKNVFIPGFVTNAEQVWLFSNAQLYVFPSLAEGFGLTALEAMLYGTPVLSSNASCMPEVYGDAVEYFDPHNLDELVDKIDGLLQNKSRREELAKLGKAKAASYSWRRMAEQTLDIYRRALSRG